MTAPAVAVVTAAESGARDRAAIAAGIPSRALMQRAGAAAAAEIARRCDLRGGVAVYAGAGNNGGDAWVVAAALAAAGAAVTVRASDPRTDDCRAERAHAVAACGGFPAPTGGERLVVDGVLGTGATGAPRGEAASLVAEIVGARERGAVVAALDVPSGVDASTGGAEGAVRAHLTLTFGTLKRGLLVARSHAGEIVVLDIGLGHHASPDDGAPRLADRRWVGAHVPAIAAEAHKGTRRKLAIVGGARGMAGAAILAADAALRSGAGMARAVVAEESVAAVQGTLPAALASPWPADDEALARAVTRWADAVLLGPGLGGDAGRAMVERVLGAFEGPVVLDADALNAFAGDVPALARLLGGRPALLTPHPVELGRLAGMDVARVLAERFDVGRELAASVGAAVLLKGVPTTVTAAGGARLVVGAGTPALATAGSGDVLGGIAATLLAQTGDAAVAGACAAWVHGRAAERATAARGGVRGTTLADVLDALPAAWRDAERDEPLAYPVLAELPAVPA